MRTIDILIDVPRANSTRARQVRSIFDVPESSHSKLQWHGELPIDEREWNIGLIVGPSGCGKTVIARQLFGEYVDRPLAWGEQSVIDDCQKELGVEEITKAFSAVGFGTIPAWLRPFKVLSNGERFRVELARRLLEHPSPIVVDEFSSVVDRQVARVASYAVSKFVRRHKKQFVAVSCHDDLVEWLQPDWIFEPAAMTFQWRSLQQPPAINCVLQQVEYRTWDLFAPYHYLTASLLKSARCFALFINDKPVTFCATRHFPHYATNNLKCISRVVTLPDWQGFGLAFALVDTIGAAHRACHLRLRCYPAHPPFIRSHVKRGCWALIKEGGTPGPAIGRTAAIPNLAKRRCCAVFEYCGAPMADLEAARSLLGR